MAREVLAGITNELHGASSPGCIHRVKRYRDRRGKIIGLGHQENYNIQHPRDWSVKPAKGEEKANNELFGLASQIMEEELSNPERYEYWYQRFETQLPTTRGSKPDPFALYNAHTGTRKRYKRFDAFVRTMIMQQLRQAKQEREQS